VAGGFVLSGPNGPLLITTSDSVFFRGGTSADAGIIVSGALLEVEGVIQIDGSLAAKKIKAEH
jgi:hypothetical protein